ncbi:MAG TPA: S8 family serine peptidase [Archangium sp.]|nr:S8 family serine peptidase [Archangium sp.]
MTSVLRQSRSALLSAVLLLTASAYAAPASSDASIDPDTRAARATDSQTDQIIIKYKPSALKARQLELPDAAEAQIARLGSQAGVPLKHLRRNFAGASVARLDKRRTVTDVLEIARRLQRADPDIEFAEPDRIHHPAALRTNDPLLQGLWGHGMIDVFNAWDSGAGGDGSKAVSGTGVTVAVIDTGYRPHEDLTANVLPGYDFITDSWRANDGNGRDSDATDTGDAVVAGECGNGSPGQDERASWHGTHVAGTIAGVGNNGLGLAGIAYGAKLLPVRVLGKCGGYDSDISDAIVWAAGGEVPNVPSNKTPAQVINMSFGGQGPCAALGSTLSLATAEAKLRGAVLIAAAGNAAMPTSNFRPANCPAVIAVAAVDRNKNKAPYSNYGSPTALAAPGGAMSYAGDPSGILSTYNSGSTSPGSDIYQSLQGTSMAAPHVSGVVALMLSKNPALRTNIAGRLLTANTSPVNCTDCGAGGVNGAKAVHASRAATVIPYSVMAGQPTSIDVSTALEYLVRGKIYQQGQSHVFNIKVPPRSRVNVELTWTTAGRPRDLDIVGGGNQRQAGDKPETVTLFNLEDSPAITTFTVKDVDANTLTNDVNFKLRLYDEVWTVPQTVFKAFYVAKLYTEGMARVPDYDGFMWNLNLLNSKACGTLAFKDTAVGFMTSPEFMSRRPTNASKLTALYRAVLARDPDTSGYNWWLDQLDRQAATWPDVVASFFGPGGEFDTTLSPIYCSVNNR